jgi:O-antigen/teichoic acid export membrane protein
MSRSGKFFKGLVPTYGYQAMLVLTGIWLTPFYLRHIGQHDYGLWLVGTQFLTFLGLADFGVVALLPLETASATGRAGGVEHAHDLPQVIGQTARLVLYQLPIVIAIAAVLWFTIPAGSQHLRGPLGIILLGFVVAFPLRMLPALLQGLQDLAFAATLGMVNWAITTAATILMVLAGWNLFALAVGWLISQLLLTPVYVYRLWTRFPEVLPRRLPANDWIAARTQLGKGIWVSVAQIAQLLMSNTDLLIIAKLLGPAAVVPYACTGKLPGVLANQAQILMQTATPGLCELKAGGSREKLLHALVALTNGLLTFSGLVFCVVLVVNRWFVTWWVNAGQYGGFWLTAAILLNMLFVHWDTAAAYSVFSLGHQRRISMTNMGNGIVTALGALVLTMWLGPIGAPLGSLAGTCLVGLPFNLRIIARDTGVGVPQLIGAMIGGWLWRFTIVAAGTCWVATQWSPQNLPAAAAAAISIAAVYSLVMLPGLLSSPLAIYLRPLSAAFGRRQTAPVAVAEVVKEA